MSGAVDESRVARLETTVSAIRDEIAAINTAIAVGNENRAHVDSKFAEIRMAIKDLKLSHERTAEGQRKSLNWVLTAVGLVVLQAAATWALNGGFTVVP